MLAGGFRVHWTWWLRPHQLIGFARMQLLTEERLSEAIYDAGVRKKLWLALHPSNNDAIS